MAFDPPDGILDIGNATLRVGKLEVAETSGLNQGLQNIIKNDLLITENTEYIKDHKWGLKLPTTWVAEFEVKGHSGKYIDFNFYNENSASNAQGYNLTFMDTSLTLKYDGGNNLPITGDTVDSTLSLGDAGYGVATIPTIVGAYRKVNIFFERGVISVSIDGTRYLYFKESDGFNQGLGVASRVVSATGSAFVNLFIEQNASNSAFKNLRIVNGRFISDQTSNIAFIGGNLGVGVNSPQETLDIRGNMHLTRVSNVSSVSVDSNVVTEYTGPHDRPLRKYPEVALTQNDESATSGYVASGSTIFSVAYEYYEAFDLKTNLVDTNPDLGLYGTWLSAASKFDSSGIAETAIGTSNTFPGTSYRGEYCALKIPNAIKLDNFHIFPRGDASSYSRANPPKDLRVFGSNDGTTWTHIKQFQNLSFTGRTGLRLHVNDSNMYNEYAFFVEKITVSSAGETYCGISGIELYGHEEGSGSLDTTLKTVYNVPATTGTQLEVYYDGQDYSSGSTITDKVANANATISSGSDITFDSTWKAWTFSSSTTRTQTIKTGTLPTSLTSSSSISAALWFKFGTVMGDRAIFHIADPQANRTANQILEIRGNVSQDYRFQLWDGQYTWQFNPPFFNNNSYDIPTGEWYHLAMSITDSSINGRKLYFNGVECDLVDGSRLTATSASELNLPSDAVLELGRRPGEGVGNTVHDAGNEFDGSIANFRLYSKALNAGQVQELYDYQKDYFLGSKSQVTLYKGHLGVGVTEPSGQLELAGDERIQEYPPGPMDDYETLIPGHGVFKAHGFQPHSSYPAWKAFDKSTSVWYSDGLGEYSGTGDYSGSTRLATETVKGAYVVLEMPYEIVLKQIKFWQQISGSHVWDRGVYYAKCNPSDEWTAIHNVTDRPADDTTPYVAYITDSRPYKYFAIVITRRHTPDSLQGVSIRNLQFFGTPGPTTLDKGSLSLTRSLDVPRISRYDVDTETPRPEKLVVDFDTTVNSSPTDISGKGNHGAFYGNATYSAADKAFKFDGDDDYIQTGSVGLSGTNPVFSISLWVNYSGGGSETLCMIGDTYNNGTTIWLDIEGSNKPRIIFVNNDVEFTDPITGLGAPLPNVWNHLVYVFNGDPVGGRSAYVNGVKQVASAAVGSVANGNLVLPSSSKLTIGALDHTSGFIHETVGKISNFKLYNVVLEPSEVKKLYNLGRTGRSMVISDTAVGIGKVPEAQLDVRGNLKVSGTINSNSPGWSYWRHSSADMNDAIYNSATDGPVGGFGTLTSFGQNWETGVSGTIADRGTGGNFDPTTGTYTAPEKGVYMVNFNFSIDGGDGGDDSMYVQFTTAGNTGGGGDWETGGAFVNRTSSTNAYMLFNPEFVTRAGREECWSINDILLLDAGSTVNVRFENVSASTTLTLLRCNFSGFKIA